MLAVLLLVLPACSDDDDDGPTSTATVATGTTAGGSATIATSPTPGATETPAADPTVASLDPVVQALLSRDPAKIEPLLQSRPEGCVEPFTAASAAPPCPAGSPAGTPVEVFPAAGCHPFMSADELAGQFEAGQDLRLYAIYRPGEAHPWVPRLPAGEMGIVLERGNLGGQIFTVAGGRLVSAYFGCGVPVADVIAPIPADSFLVAPPR